MDTGPSLDRIERLLALLVTENIKSKQQKAILLNIAGFSNVEIADILQTSSAVVAQLLYESRRSRRRKK